MPKISVRKKPNKGTAQSALIALQGLNKADSALTPMNFRVPETFHREFKLYAVEHGTSMVDLLQKSFDLLKKTRSVSYLRAPSVTALALQT